MPKVRRQTLPRPLWAHLLQRFEERGVTVEQLRQFSNWLATEPEVPNERWYKRFGGMIVCGEGELVKTFLMENQTPIGREL